MPAMDYPRTAKLIAFAEQAALTLHKDERIRLLWLTESLAKGTADAQSDVDLRVAVWAADFATIDQWWQDLLNQVAPLVWKYRWPGPPDEAILGAIACSCWRTGLIA